MENKAKTNNKKSTDYKPKQFEFRTFKELKKFSQAKKNKGTGLSNTFVKDLKVKYGER